jgi:hypothetical protein
MTSEGNVNVRQENYEKKIMYYVITAVTVNTAMQNGVWRDEMFSDWEQCN